MQLELNHQLSVYQLEVEMFALKSARLPAFPPELSSVIRGALQASITKLFCRRKEGRAGKQCARCQCLHKAWIQPSMPSTHPMARKFQNPPPPLLIRSFPQRRVYAAGDSLQFQLSLIGRPLEAQLSDLILALQQLAFQGLGQEPGSFYLGKITALSNQEKQSRYELFPSLSPTVPAQVLPPMPSHKIDQVKLSFESLTVLLNKGNAILMPSFAELVERLWNRINLLNTLYGNGPLEMDNLPTNGLSRIQAIPLSLQAGIWDKKPSDRNGNRRLSRKPIVGFKGEIMYQGAGIEKYYPILKLGELLQIGKLSTFGFGCFKVMEETK